VLCLAIAGALVINRDPVSRRQRFAAGKLAQAGVVLRAIPGQEIDAASPGLRGRGAGGGYGFGYRFADVGWAQPRLQVG
jgi:hypothetical protein